MLPKSLTPCSLFITDANKSPICERMDDVRESIINIVTNCNDVSGIHDLRTRSVGNIYYIELHLEIDGEISLYSAHKISHKVEDKLLAIYPSSQVLIHQDPFGVKEDRLDNQINGFCKI